MKLSVIGCGYLGAVHAAAMASIGHEVVGIDVDERKIASLSTGQAPFFEPGLPEILTQGVEAGNLRFTTDVSEAKGAKVHFIGVGTPQQKDGYAADLTYVNAAIDALLPHLSPGDIVAGKSTVPVGTAAALAERIAPTGATLVWNPEFLREGWAVQDTIDPDRLVVGVPGGGVSTRSARSTNEGGAGLSTNEGDSARATNGGDAGLSADEHAVEVLREVYHPAIAKGTPFIVTDLATAELVKVAANAFLATKISFINAMAEIAEVTGADVTQLADAIGHDARIGRKFLGAGIGFGGGCLPKDIRAFAARAEELGRGESVGFLREVDAINLRRRERAVALVADALGGSVVGKHVTVLGAAFKPHSDDIRDSPALDVAVHLRGLGAEVVVTDPEAIENARRQHPQLTYVEDRDEALHGADAVVVVTEWDEYRRNLTPEHAGELVAGRIVVDGRNCLDAAAWRAAGWTYFGMGRP
ncbi:UDP-glucose dehydrogenase family protein [Microbacterium tumbae]